MEKLRKLIEEIEKDHNKVLCFYGHSLGINDAMRLYLCYDSNVNLYSKLLPYEPLLGKLVRIGRTTWEELEKAIKNKESNNVEKWNSVRLIHGEYHSLGLETDHGAQVCAFDSLEAMMKEVTSPMGHCFLANPKHKYFDHHSILTKEQMFKDALKFCQDKKDWKFLFEWGDNVEEVCNSYTPVPSRLPKQKDDRYYNLKEQRKLMKQILELDPNHKVKYELPKVEEELKEYE
jgi:hypothetical protein